MIRLMWHYFNFLVLLGGPKAESGRSEVSRFVERLRCVDVCHGYTLCQCAQLRSTRWFDWISPSWSGSRSLIFPSDQRKRRGECACTRWTPEHQRKSASLQVLGCWRYISSVDFWSWMCALSLNDCWFSQVESRAGHWRKYFRSSAEVSLYM